MKRNNKEQKDDKRMKEEGIEAPKNKNDEEYQFNLAIEISTIEVKEKGLFVNEEPPWVRKEFSLRILVDNREADAKASFKKKPPHTKLTKKLKGPTYELKEESESENEEESP